MVRQNGWRGEGGEGGPDACEEASQCGSSTNEGRSADLGGCRRTERQGSRIVICAFRIVICAPMS